MTAGPSWRRTSVPRPVDEVEKVELDGRLVLWHEGRMHRLDELGSELWRRFDGRSDLWAIARDCAETFAVARQRTLADLVRLCEALEAQGVIEGNSEVPQYAPSPTPGPTPVVGPGDPPRARDLEGVDWALESRPFRAIEHRFRIRSTDPSVGRYLSEALGAMGSDGPSDRWYSVVGPPETTDGYEVFLDEIGLASVPDARGAVRHTLWHVNSEAVRTCTDRLVVHASAAVADGQVILMPGTINAGKSTLVAGLAAAGFDYLTDEFAVIDPDTLLVHAYPRPLNLGADVWDVVPQLRPRSTEPELARSFRTWHVNPASIDSTRISEPMTVGFVIAPRYVAGGGTSITSIPRDEALKLLVDQSMNLHRFGRRGFRALADIVLEATCMRLQLDSLPTGVSAVRSVVDDRPSDGISDIVEHGG